MPVSQFKTPQVRDLAWVIKSPGLLDAAGKNPFLLSQSQIAQSPGESGLIIDDPWCAQQFSRHTPWLQALDNSPQRFLEWLKPRQNPRLGYYFESLVEYWLRHDDSIKRLIPHLQIKDLRTKDQQTKDQQKSDSQRTVGEFDFLLQEADQPRIQHWEVAVKFYLQYQHEDGRTVWYGPNPRDRLDLKLQRLFQHQLVLSRHPSAITAMQKLDLNLPVWPRLLLKGYLFYRSNSDWGNVGSHFPGLSAHHLRGWWTFLQPFEIPNAASESRWLFLPRLQWLAPARITPEGENKLMNIRELHSFCLDLLKRQQRPPLIVELRRLDSGFWQEVSRGFVVPQDWPGIAEKL